MLQTIEERGIELRPGDVLAHNHPYLGASHTLDIAIIAPVFLEGELVAFSANTAHHLDIGGAQPGGTIDLFDMYAEGDDLQRDVPRTARACATTTCGSSSPTTRARRAR